MTSRCIAVTLSAALLMGVSAARVSPAFAARLTAPSPPYPWKPFSSALPLRAQMRFWAEEREAALDVVAVRDGEDLLIVGLAPFGPRLFTLRQVGRTRKLSFGAARNVPAADLGLRCAPPHLLDHAARAGSGRARFELGVGGRAVSEVLGTDGERQRAFGRSDDDGGAVIEYPPPTDQESDAIVMRNTWCGFEAKVLPIGDRRP